MPLWIRFARACASVEGEVPSAAGFAILGGADPARWRRGIAAFGGLRCRNIADGVDLRLKPGGDACEYDLVLAPGADASALALCVKGVRGLMVEDDGRLRIDTPAGPLHQSIPATFCEASDGTRTPLECRFRVLGPDSFGFELGEHAKDRAVVIDPVLARSTYLGGSQSDTANSIAVTGMGEAVVAGSTLSTDFPTVRRRPRRS